tara:strand:+ start:55 stop:714 length:660 start_codon:yes stop_codon:yes gene_type:complete
MAITYPNFLTQVRSYTEVDSNVLTDILMDQFISNIELDIAGKVDYDDLRKYATASFISGQRYISLPSDMLVLRSVQTIISSTRTFLEKRDTSFISEYNNDGATGSPLYYANWDENNFLVAPTPDATAAAGQVQINYIKYPPHFTSSNTTYLSTYQQQLLLYGVLVESFAYLKGPADMYKLYSDKYNEQIQSFALQQMGRRRRDEYTDGVPRVKVSSPSP